MRTGLRNDDFRFNFDPLQEIHGVHKCPTVCIVTFMNC